MAKKGLDTTFLHYGIRKEDINLILKDADENRKKEFDVLAGISENIETILTEIEEAKNRRRDLRCDGWWQHDDDRADRADCCDGSRQHDDHRCGRCC